MCQFLPQFYAGLVHIASQVERAYLVQMAVAEAVEGAHVGFGPVRYRYHVVEPALHQRQRIHHTLGDDKTLLTYGCIDVPGYELAVALDREVLRG